jgi:hypothetical protein
MNPKRKFIINAILLGFAILDLAYAVAGLLFPEIWSKTIHGIEAIDLQGLLQRTAAIWAAFAVLQFIAFLKWQSKAYWLAMIAGLRFSELFADWTYLYFAQDLTWLGHAGLFISTPTNMAICWFLLKSYLKLQENICAKAS